MRLGDMIDAQAVKQHVRYTESERFKTQLRTFTKAQLKKYLNDDRPKIKKHHTRIYAELNRRKG